MSRFKEDRKQSEEQVGASRESEELERRKKGCGRREEGVLYLRDSKHAWGRHEALCCLEMAEAGTM